jgi:hypothetical protein
MSYAVKLAALVDPRIKIVKGEAAVYRIRERRSFGVDGTRYRVPGCRICVESRLQLADGTLQLDLNRYAQVAEEPEQAAVMFTWEEMSTRVGQQEARDAIQQFEPKV